MTISEFEQDIRRTLSYYEIFDYPLSAQELYALFPKNSIQFPAFVGMLDGLVLDNKLIFNSGYYHLAHVTKNLSEIRSGRSKIAIQRLKVARLMVQIIKRFPYVRGIFLSGELSKLVATPGSDIDYVIVTAPGRLWIVRTLLISFKKVFLFNQKKFFCLNYFVTENCLEIEEKNYYTATEVAHLKPLYNFPLFLQYMNTNSWIKSYFPNYSLFMLTSEPAHESRMSIIRAIFELLLSGAWAKNLDTYLMNKMKAVWKSRYNGFDEKTREQLFRCTPDESRAFVGNFSEKIQKLYDEKLKTHNVE